MTKRSKTLPVVLVIWTPLPPPLFRLFPLPLLPFLPLAFPLPHLKAGIKSNSNASKRIIFIEHKHSLPSREKNKQKKSNANAAAYVMANLLLLVHLLLPQPGLVSLHPLLSHPLVFLPPHLSLRLPHLLAFHLQLAAHLLLVAHLLQLFLFVHLPLFIHRNTGFTK